MGHGGQVVNRLGRRIGHRLAQGGTVGDIGLHIDQDHVVAGILQMGGQPLTHETLATRDECSHR
jgi:hypothetical protein